MVKSNSNLGYLLVRASRAHHILATRTFGKLGLHHGQPPVLFELNRHDGLTHNDLAEMLVVTPATISNLIQRMEVAGFVQRRRDAQDERISRVYLTDAGRSILAEALALAEEMDTTAFAGLSSEEQTTLANLLQRVEKNMTG